MKGTYYVLSASDMKRLANDLRKFVNDVHKKTEIFIRELSKLGADVAKANLGNYGKYLLVHTSMTIDKAKVEGKIVLSNVGIIHSTWYVSDGQGGATQKTAEVNPMLMVEYGAGKYADEAKALKLSKAPSFIDVSGMGRGTFPDQTHAFEDGWYYATAIDEEGKPTDWHYSTGVKAQMPMFNAWFEMATQVINVARKVF